MKYYLLIVCSFFVFSCANPVMPTGGPVDSKPPEIIKTEPESGTVNFKGDEIRFYFDEYVQQASFKQAFSIEPDLGIQYDIRFKGKSVLIKLKSKLPENTTFIAELGTAVSDFKSNKIKKPYTLAISTGERMNNGEIKIKFLQAINGDKVESSTLMLFKESQSYAEKSYYVGKPDSSGTIRFSYLPEGKYKIIALDDINRNRSKESFEWAQPIYSEIVDVKQDTSIEIKTIYYSKPDTLRPEISGIGVFSANRLRLRFSEDVFLTSDSTLSVFSDSDTLNFRILFNDKDDFSVYWAVSRDAFKESKEYTANLPTMIDGFRNSLNTNSFSFVSDIISDTTLLRIVKLEPQKKMNEFDTLRVYYNGFINKSIIDSLEVIEQDTKITGYSYSKIEDHILLIYPEKKWDPLLKYQFRLFNPASANYLTQSPVIVSSDEIASIELIRSDSLRYNQLNQWVVELIGENYYKRIHTSDKKIVVDKIGDMSLLVRAFDDQNGNDSWDSGKVEPYEKPEPFFIQKKVNLQKKMTATLTIDF
jgi:hypothetical protein